MRISVGQQQACNSGGGLSLSLSSARLSAMVVVVSLYGDNTYCKFDGIEWLQAHFVLQAGAQTHHHHVRTPPVPSIQHALFSNVRRPDGILSSRGLAADICVCVCVLHVCGTEHLCALCALYESYTRTHTHQYWYICRHILLRTLHSGGPCVCVCRELVRM